MDPTDVDVIEVAIAFGSEISSLTLPTVLPTAAELVDRYGTGFENPTYWKVSGQLLLAAESVADPVAAIREAIVDFMLDPSSEAAKVARYDKDRSVSEMVEFLPNAVLWRHGLVPVYVRNPMVQHSGFNEHHESIADFPMDTANALYRAKRTAGGERL